ncbi:MAG: large subunit ribosomal protein L29 [Bacteroidetes bacterium]|nr:MAG: large subunit ribosomal protein L29 [Bacteroidota bacterium]
MKNKDIQALSVTELQGRIREEKETLEKLSLGHAVSPIESPAKLRTTRRTIARLVTELRKKENAAKN